MTAFPFLFPTVAAAVIVLAALLTVVIAYPPRWLRIFFLAALGWLVVGAIVYGIVTMVGGL